MRVLLIEGNILAAEKLSLILKGAGFKADHTDESNEAVKMVRHYDYDLILLNAAMLATDGYDVVRRVRAAKIATPMILLSVACRPEVKVKAFGAGADDFLTLPFDPAELVARMHAILRRSKGYSEQILRVGGLELCLDRQSVCFNNKPMLLTCKEYAVLKLLALRKGTVVKKDTLLNYLYGGLKEPDVKIIDVFVCKLRKKLQLAGAGDMIATSWGRGYVLNAEPSSTVAPSGAALIPPGFKSDQALLPSAA